tara:strand:- start:919 stop:2817 length:1899 start_codon:yes stop_codon:yes gene_type:complete
MAQRKVNKTEGHYLAGDKITFDDELNFVTTANPEIDTQGGGFIWRTLTNIINSWRLTDTVTSEDILSVDTQTAVKTVTLHPNYTAVGFGGGGVFTPTTNSNSMVEVSQESDFGTLVGNTRTLAANTTYFIRGEVTCVNLLAITNSGTAIRGWDRETARLSYVGVAGLGDFITITDVSAELIGVEFKSTNNTAMDVLLRASNFNYTQTVPPTYDSFNAGRTKVLTIINCQFRDCFDVHHIEGFDLVDIQNCLFWYIEATAMGCHFKNVSKLQISSCEYVRWFDETSLPTPSGYATVPMIELRENGVNGPGFGAVNITGCIIHPQQTQDGLRLQPGSTTGFGTITGNTLINVGLTPNSHVATITLSGTSGTAEILIGLYQPYLVTFNADLTTTAADFVTVFADELLFRYGIALTSSGADIIFTSAAAGNVFYITSITNVTTDLAGTLVHSAPIEGVVADLELDSQNGYIVQANQGLKNSNSIATLSIIDNVNNLNTATTNPQVLAAANVDTGAFSNAASFPQAQRVITDRELCSITYNNKNTGSFMVVVSGTVEMSGDGFIRCRLRSNGNAISFSEGSAEIRQGRGQALAFSVIGVATLGDVFDVEFTALDTDNATLNSNDILVREFVLNGYQF